MKEFKINEVDFLLIIKKLERISDRCYLSDNEEVSKVSDDIDRIIDDLNDSIIK